MNNTDLLAAPGRGTLPVPNLAPVVLLAVMSKYQ